MNQGQWIRQAKKRLNVIFIHGINSSEECWRHKNGTYWPNLLNDESELADVGIYVFSYRTDSNTGSYSLSDIVDSLREYFLLDGLIDSLGIVFVCHSMGGIVARRFLVKEQSLLFTRGLDTISLFLVASPSLGSEYANMLSLVSKVLGHTQASALQFSQNNVWLNDLDKDFMNFKANENLKIKGKELIEDLPLYGKGLIKKQIVEPFSGARYFGNSFKVPGSDHSTIATPANRDAVQNRLLVQFIKESFLEKFKTPSISASESLHSKDIVQNADDILKTSENPHPLPIKRESLENQQIPTALEKILEDNVYTMLKSSVWLGRYVETLAKSASVSEETMLKFCRSRDDIGLFQDGERWVAALQERLDPHN
jgi:Alpha/beta hydrolase family